MLAFYVINRRFINGEACTVFIEEFPANDEVACGRDVPSAIARRYSSVPV
jgi:hypothetical protein